MRKVLWLIVCLMTMVLSVNAENQNANESVNETQEAYCMIVGTQKLMSTKCTFTIDYGQSTKFWGGANKQKLVDDNGKAIKFNSVIDACNYLAEMDWVLVSAYPMSSSQGNCYHYLFKKTIKKGEKITFNTKANYNEENSDGVYY